MRISAASVAAAAAGRPLFTEPIHILGAGAIGMLLAASVRCVFPSYPVKLLFRDTAKNRNLSKSVSICLRQGFGAQQQQQHGRNDDKPPRSSSSSSSSPRIVHVPCETVGASGSTKSIRNLVVTTKAVQAVSAVESVQHRLTESARIVILCNGALAVADELTNRLPKARTMIRLALTTHGAYRETSDEDDNDDDDDELQHLVHAGYGNIVLQGWEELAVLFDLCGLNCSHLAASDPTMERLLWNKLAANCVINPLTALHGCLNAEIRQLPNFETHYYPAILKEVAQVYYTAATLSNNGDVSSVSTVAEVEAELRAYVDTVIRDTAQNRSSMLQDAQAGRFTEVDYLSGYVVRTGAARGIPTPVNEELWRAVQSLQEQNRARE